MFVLFDEILENREVKPNSFLRFISIWSLRSDQKSSKILFFLLQQIEQKYVD